MKNSNFKRKKVSAENIEDLIKNLINGDRVALSRAITICESTNADDRVLANQIINACLPKSGNSIRIGITGVPGVGKSTFIESFGQFLIKTLQKKVAVLAVDPTSGISKGSILGDKTRMDYLSREENAFIRPSPSGGALGGVANQSRESILLCEAAGFEIILVETVGVGQSETEVKEMTDFFLLLMLAGAGDELQGIKRGIMEMADGILINKADGHNKIRARNAKKEYQNALHLFPKTESGWIPRVEVCSAIENENIDKVWELIDSYFKLIKENGFFEKQRKRQRITWFKAVLNQMWYLELNKNDKLKSKKNHLENEVKEGLTSPYFAAKELIKEATTNK